MGFSWPEYWSGLPFPSSGDLPNPGIEPGSLALQADALPPEPSGIGTTIILVLLKIGNEQLAEGSTVKESMLVSMPGDSVVLAQATTTKHHRLGSWTRVCVFVLSHSRLLQPCGL